MDYFVIEVPDMNDSVVKVSLQSRLYQLRFTWNDTGGYWMLGVMDSLGTPLLLGVKMVPQFPLNLLFGRDDMPRHLRCPDRKGERRSAGFCRWDGSFCVCPGMMLEQIIR